MASLLTGGSKVSDMLTRSALQAGLSRTNPVTSSLSLSRAAFSPRGQPLGDDSPSAGGLPTSAAGSSPLKGGVGLAHLGLAGRGGTPRLGGYPPTAEPFNSSMAYLSPDESASQHPLHLSSTLLPVPSAVGPVGMVAPAPSGGRGNGSAAGRPGAHPLLAAPTEMPLSWVPPLALSRERLDTRCPRGERVVRYRKARRELYALFGECARWDGLVSV